MPAEPSSTHEKLVTDSAAGNPMSLRTRSSPPGAWVCVRHEPAALLEPAAVILGWTAGALHHPIQRQERRHRQLSHDRSSGRIEKPDATKSGSKANASLMPRRRMVSNET